MRHRVAGRKLGRTTSHRRALLRNLSMDLIEKEKITTTLAKAKEVRRFAEKLVTLSKKETLHARRLALQQLPSRRGRLAVAKLFDTLSARYSQRPGGYTRILKLGPRRGDHAEMALIEFVAAGAAASADDSAGGEKGAKSSKKSTAKKSTRKKAAPRKDAEESAKPSKKTSKKATKKTTKKATKKKTTKKAASKKGSDGS